MFLTRPEAPRPKSKDPETTSSGPGPDGRGTDEEKIELMNSVDEDAILPAEKRPAEEEPELIDIEAEALPNEEDREMPDESGPEQEPDLLTRIDQVLKDEHRSQNEAVSQAFVGLDQNDRMKIARTEQLQNVLFMRSAAKRKETVFNQALGLVSDRLETAAAGSGRQLIELKQARAAHHADEGAYREILDDEHISEATKADIRAKLSQARDGLEQQLNDRENALNIELGVFPKQIEKLYSENGKHLNLYRDLLKEVGAEERRFQQDVERIGKNILAVKGLRMVDSGPGDLNAELGKALRAGKKKASDLLEIMAVKREQLEKRVEIVQKRHKELFRMHAIVNNIGKTEDEMVAKQAESGEPEESSPVEGLAEPSEPFVAAAEGQVTAEPEEATGSENPIDGTETPAAADDYHLESVGEGSDTVVRPAAAPDDVLADTAQGEVLDADTLAALAQEEERGGAAAKVDKPMAIETGREKAKEDHGSDWELFKKRVSPSVEEGTEPVEFEKEGVWEGMDAETRKVFLRTIEDVPLAERPIFKKTVESIWKDKHYYTADRIHDTLKELYKRQINDQHPENGWALRRALTAPDTNAYRGDRQVRLADVLAELMRFLPETVNRGSKVNYWRMLDKLAKIKF